MLRFSNLKLGCDTLVSISRILLLGTSAKKIGEKVGAGKREYAIRVKQSEIILRDNKMIQWEEYFIWALESIAHMSLNDILCGGSVQKLKMKSVNIQM